jgi:hypothetical protein
MLEEIIGGERETENEIPRTRRCSRDIPVIDEIFMCVFAAADDDDVVV